jgi:hypothetical protein
MKQHHGLALVPRPSEDPRDPLRWPRWLKIVALGATAFTNFTSNFAGSGLSVATVLLGKEFDKTDGQINALLTVSRSRSSKQVRDNSADIRLHQVQLPLPRHRQFVLGPAITQDWETSDTLTSIHDVVWYTGLDGQGGDLL